MKTFPMVLSFALLAGAAFCRSDSIQLLSEYNGAESVPYPTINVVGTFNIRAGDFDDCHLGNVRQLCGPEFVGADRYLGSVVVAHCVYLSTCNHIPTAWSYTLTSDQIASLGTGSVDFSARHTSFNTVRLDETALRQVDGAATAMSCRADRVRRTISREARWRGRKLCVSSGVVHCVITMLPR